MDNTNHLRSRRLKIMYFSEKEYMRFIYNSILVCKICEKEPKRSEQNFSHYKPTTKYL